MIVAENSYRYTEALRKNFRKQQIATLTTYLILGGTWTILQTDVVLDRLSGSWPLILLTVAVISILRLTVRRSRHRSRQDTVLKIAQEGLVWQQREQPMNEIKWPEISQYIIYLKKQTVYSSRIIDCQQRSITLAGFEPADELCESIKAALGSDIPILYKDVIIDWRDPYVPSYIMVFILLPAYLALTWLFGEVAIDIVLATLRFGVAAFVIVYKPVKRVNQVNQKLRYLDLIIGLLLLTFALISTLVDFN